LEDIWEVPIQDLSLGAWNLKLEVYVDVFHKQRLRLLTELPHVKVNHKQDANGDAALFYTEEVMWIETYENTYHGSTRYLPYENTWLATFKDDDRCWVWLWLYLCRRIKVPGCFPKPGPVLEWHPKLHLWVGPDGHVIRKKQEKDFLANRKQLRKAMLEDVSSARWSKELNFLGEHQAEFPPPEVDPPAVEVPPSEWARNKCNAD
jgi:hypothetical protein